MKEFRNIPVNPYPQPTEKLEDREMYPFAGPFRPHPDYSQQQLAFPLVEPERKVPRFDGDR